MLLQTEEFSLPKVATGGLVFTLPKRDGPSRERNHSFVVGQLHGAMRKEKVCLNGASGARSVWTTADVESHFPDLGGSATRKKASDVPKDHTLAIHQGDLPAGHISNEDALHCMPCKMLFRLM